MAVITFEFVHDGKVARGRAAAIRNDERMGWEFGIGGFIPDRLVTSVRRWNTMRSHCFYCWYDADWISGTVKTCDKHAGDDKVELLEKYEPGMHDDPVESEADATVLQLTKRETHP